MPSKKFSDYTAAKPELTACPVRKALEAIGGKWRLLLVSVLAEAESLRYGQLKRQVPEISEKMLIQELRALAKLGLVARRSYGEVPPRVEYRLTEQGRQLVPLIEQLIVFGEQLPPVGQASR